MFQCCPEPGDEYHFCTRLPPLRSTARAEGFIKTVSGFSVKIGEEADGRLLDESIFGVVAGHGIPSGFLPGGMMRVRHLIQFIDKCRNFWFEFREFVGDDIPDD
jgi:hypothetical protein